MSPDGFALVHIAAGLAAIAAGFFALFARKGGRVHRQAGSVAAYAMLLMLAGGIVMAVITISSAPVENAHVRFQRINMTGAIIAFYLVATSLLTVRRPARGGRWLDVALTIVVAACATYMYQTAFGALANPKAKLLGYPFLPTFLFGTIGFLCATGDLRILMGRVLTPAKRLARHLSRMTFGMFAITGSFFFGQSHMLASWLQIPALLAVPPIVVAVLLFYWWGRMLITKRMPGARPRERAVIAGPAEVAA